MIFQQTMPFIPIPNINFILLIFFSFCFGFFLFLTVHVCNVHCFFSIFFWSNFYICFYHFRKKKFTWKNSEVQSTQKKIEHFFGCIKTNKCARIYLLDNDDSVTIHLTIEMSFTMFFCFPFIFSIKFLLDVLS